VAQLIFSAVLCEILGALCGCSERLGWNRRGQNRVPRRV